MSKEMAEKGKLTDGLKAQGWALFDGTWSKTIQVPQFVEKEHENGGVPDVGIPTLDDLLNAVNESVEVHGLSPRDLAIYLNNGLYLAYNAKAKPKASTSQNELLGIFSTTVPAASPLWQEFAKAGASHKVNEFLKEWYNKQVLDSLT